MWFNNLQSLFQDRSIMREITHSDWKTCNSKSFFDLTRWRYVLQRLSQHFSLPIECRIHLLWKFFWLRCFDEKQSEENLSYQREETFGGGNMRIVPRMLQPECYNSSVNLQKFVMVDDIFSCDSGKDWRMDFTLGWGKKFSLGTLKLYSGSWNKVFSAAKKHKRWQELKS